MCLPAGWGLELEVEELRESLVVVEAEAVVRRGHRRLQRQERLQLHRFWKAQGVALALDWFGGWQYLYFY